MTLALILADVALLALALGFLHLRGLLLAMHIRQTELEKCWHTLVNLLTTPSTAPLPASHMMPTLDPVQLTPRSQAEVMDWYSAKNAPERKVS